MAAPIPGLRITSKLDGFRRAGIAHSSKPVDHPISKFTDKEIAALKGEPNLVVVDVELEPEPAKARAK